MSRGRVGLDGLTDKNRLFAQHYATNGGNGMKAAIDAGYSATRARQTGTKLLKDPAIVAIIHGLAGPQLAAATAALIKTRAERQSWWSRVMDDIDASMGDRLKASELLARSQGDFLDRVHVNATVTTQLPAGMTREDLLAVAVMAIPELDSGVDPDAVN